MSVTDTDTLDLLGTARPDRRQLAELVRAATGDAGAVPLEARAETVDYQFGTPSTAGLFRLRGTARLSDGSTAPWAVFVKRLQSVRHWENLHLIPEPMRQDFIDNMPWWLEVAAQRSGVGELLPVGMRLPAAYRIDKTDDDRATIWMEHITEQPHLVEPLMPRPGIKTPGTGLRYYTQGRVRMSAIPALSDDATWQHPLLKAAVCSAGDHGLRTDLMALGRRTDEVLDLLDRLPQTYQHGDASPQNLLVAAEDPDTFVVIDWGFDCPQAVGFDLGQLLIGLGHAGLLEPEELLGVHEVIADAYTEGLNAAGPVATAEQVRFGYLGSLLLRSAFTALPLEQFGAPQSDGLAELFGQRVRLTRFMVDLMRDLDLAA